MRAAAEIAIERSIARRDLNTSRASSAPGLAMNAPRLGWSETTPRLGEHDEDAPDLRTAGIESVAERRLRQFRAGRKPLLHDRRDDPLDDRRVRQRLMEFVFGDRHEFCPNPSSRPLRATRGMALDVLRAAPVKGDQLPL